MTRLTERFIWLLYEISFLRESTLDEVCLAPAAHLLLLQRRMNTSGSVTAVKTRSLAWLHPVAWRHHSPGRLLPGLLSLTLTHYTLPTLASSRRFVFIVSVCFWALVLAVGPCHVGFSSMWRAALVVFLFSAPCQHVWAQEGAITPQDCSLDCIKEV